MTPHKRRIAQLRASGLTRQEVADKLGISIRTVDNHMDVVYHELDVHNIAQLAKKLDESLGSSS